jgi:hypothetical protein
MSEDALSSCLPVLYLYDSGISNYYYILSMFTNVNNQSLHLATE